MTAKEATEAPKTLSTLERGVQGDKSETQLDL